jgi:hypothetical protein
MTQVEAVCPYPATACETAPKHEAIRKLYFDSSDCGILIQFHQIQTHNGDDLRLVRKNEAVRNRQALIDFLIFDEGTLWGLICDFTRTTSAKIPVAGRTDYA